MKLFESYKIGKLELKNRLIMSPMTLNLPEDGFATERIVRFYEERAKGGVGAIIVEDGIVDVPIGNNMKNALAIHDDKCIPGLREIITRAHKYGTKVLIQISHGGRRSGRLSKSGCLDTTRGMIPVAPSAIPHPVPGYVVPKELTIEEIQEIIDKFHQATRRAVKAGFDSVGLHCAHMYLTGEFLSPWANKRNDEYGGDFNRRLRFVLEIIEGMKKELGPNRPLFVRMNGQEPEGGNSLEDIRRIAQRFEEAGVDAISVSVGFAAPVKDPTFIPSIAPASMPEGCIVHLAENIKKGVSIPVIVANRIPDARFAEKILQEGGADLISLGRPLIADPEFAKKSMEGRFDDVVPCIYCCQGCAQNVVEKDAQARCNVNPLAGREIDFEIKPALKRKRVLVIGGGPGGLEAAIIAVNRGHDVSILEKATELGGYLSVCSVAPGKSDIKKFARYLKTQVSKLGIKVDLGKEATSDLVEEIQPDAVILAIGSNPIIPAIVGVDKKNVFTAIDVLQGEALDGRRVVIIGGGMVGLETAEYLAKEGKEVTIVEMLEELAPEMPAIPKFTLLGSLEEHQVRILTKTTAEEITDTGVLVISRRGNKETIPADAVVLAVGFNSNKDLVEKLKEKVPELYTVGDCVRPRRILEAMKEGFEAALKL